MKRFLFIVTILLLAANLSMADDYWHFGVGIRATGVIPNGQDRGGNNYSNALGTGVLLTFGDPDSRFTTQVDLDKWSVNYTNSNVPITFWGVEGDSSSIQTRASKYQFGGLAVGIYEKYRTFEFSSKLSNYIIGGLGAYFLNGKFEESLSPYVGTRMTSRGYSSDVMAAAGLGFDARVSDHLTGFVEGRFNMIVSHPKKENDQNPIDNLMHGYFGVKYVF
jgi:hypothetical protein